MTEINRIAVLGDGAWGTAFSMILASSGKSPIIWGHDPAYLDEMRASRENRLFLPGIRIPDEIGFESDIRKNIREADAVVVAIPSKFLRSCLETATGALNPAKPVLSLTKGIDSETLERPTQLIRDILKAEDVAVLSGPSHAEEIARGLPTSVVAASDFMKIARRVQRAISTPLFRVYASRDLEGVEIAGAVKNVIALAAGMAHGLGLGDNALASLATRGLAEMVRLGTVMDGETSTFYGLAGMGDLFTTCISQHGRNRRVGLLLAEGKSLCEILANMNGVPESVTTTRSVLALAEKHFIEMPITREVAAVIWDGKSPKKAVTDLMTRSKKDED